jgi:8-oxo-dGTP pyrophosphatase MutT (NUDIX family)
MPPDYVRQLRAKIGSDLLFLPSVTAVVINERSEVLLQRRSDNGQWGLLSGHMEPGEEPADAVIREVMEEAGIEVIPEQITGVYSGPDYLRREANGNETLFMNITFRCRPVSGEARVNDDESLGMRYFPCEPSDQLPEMGAINYERIQHALRDDPRVFFRRRA